MRSALSFSIIALTAATIIVSALIVSSGQLWNIPVSSFLGLAGDAGSVGVAEAANLPFDVDENFRKVEKTGDGAPNGAGTITVSELVDPDQHCEFCMRVEFTPGHTGKGGIVMESDKAFDFNKATRIAFFARGETGTEDVQFKAAGKDVKSLGGSAKTKYAVESQQTRLQKDWQKIEIDLTAKDLKAITHALAVDLGKAELKNSKQPIVIYLKGITLDDSASERPLAAAQPAT